MSGFSDLFFFLFLSLPLWFVPQPFGFFFPLTFFIVHLILSSNPPTPILLDFFLKAATRNTVFNEARKAAFLSFPA